MAMQTPDTQILPPAPSTPDLPALTKWAQGLTRTLHQNLSGIARKANDAGTFVPTGNLDMLGFNILGVGALTATDVHIAGLGATDERVVRTDGTTGDVQASTVALTDTGALSGVTTLAMGGALSGVTSLTMAGAFTGATTGDFSGLLTLTGGQIAFPATQVPSAGANVLDDYEEGTYTPVITATTGTFTSVTAISGSYIKIGRFVLVNTQCTLTTIGTASGNVIATLPFTIGTGPQWNGDGRSNVIGGAMLQTILAAGGTAMSIAKYDNTSAIVATAQISTTTAYWV